MSDHTNKQKRMIRLYSSSRKLVEIRKTVQCISIHQKRNINTTKCRNNDTKNNKVVLENDDHQSNNQQHLPNEFRSVKGMEDMFSLKRRKYNHLVDLARNLSKQYGFQEVNKSFFLCLFLFLKIEMNFFFFLILLFYYF